MSLQAPALNLRSHYSNNSDSCHIETYSIMDTKQKKQFTKDKVIFEQEGVFIHTRITATDDDALIPGKIFLQQRPEGIYVEWKPVNEDGEMDWSVIDTVGFKASRDPDQGAVIVQASQLQQKHKYIVNFDLKELKSLKRSKPSLGWAYLIFILKDGSTYPPLHFHQGGSKDFTKQLEKYVSLKKSASDSQLYLVREHDPQALSKSFDELQLFADHAPDIVTKFINDPYKATMSGFAKVTNLLKDALLQQDEPQRPSEEVAALHRSLQEEIPDIDINQDEPGFEVISKHAEIPARPEVKRFPPLSAQQWSSYMDQEGRVVKVAELNETIFRGGVEPMIRIEVWKFLLGYYEWDSTYKTRMETRKKRVDDYFKMKLQWKSVSEDQERRFSMLKERKNLIEKDVTRTDRTHRSFEGEDNPNLAVLYDILMTYCMYDFDLGYVQGMSDLLAPILVIMENEVDAFWCFSGFMDRVHSNFELDQKGMKEQLAQVHTLLKFLDPALSNYLESHDSGNMYFCFRWLLIVFKREFTFPCIMRLWEVLWTGHPCQNFHLLVCLAMLDSEKNTLMENNFGFTEILRHINDMSLKIDLEESLSKAEGMHIQLKDCKNLPRNIGQIVGMCESREASPTSSSSTTPSEPDKTQLQLPIKQSGSPKKGASQNTNTGSSTPKSSVTTPDSIEIVPDLENGFNY